MPSAKLTIVVVAAHPDDEIAGAGIWLHRNGGKKLHVVHLTDGSPQDMQTARSLGFETREAYARARRLEFAKAMELAKVPADQCAELGYPDQEAHLNFPDLIAQLDSLIASLRPVCVLSPAYEGGHPDHDSAACAVAAVHLKRKSFAHRQFPLYHSASDGSMVTGRFLHPPGEVETLTLSPEERALKASMLACFETQADILSKFALDQEVFRSAPFYDFTAPPHPGPLQYERWGWGIAGERWRDYASAALKQHLGSGF